MLFKHMRDVHSIILQCEKKAFLSFNYGTELTILFSQQIPSYRLYDSVGEAEKTSINTSAKMPRAFVQKWLQCIHFKMLIFNDNVRYPGYNFFILSEQVHNITQCY